MTRRTRRRLRIASLAIFCLLFQQLAMAAYACTMTAPPAEPVAAAAHCAKMGLPQIQDNPVLCAKHCAPDHATVVDAVKLSVPPLATPPPVHGLTLAEPAVHAVVEANAPIARWEPPPRLRYCSLLI